VCSAKVDSSYYCDVVLNQGLLPDIQVKLSGNNFTFQPQGAPAHCSRQTVAFLRLRVREFVEPENWPLNSPDLNPVYSSRSMGALQQLVFRRRRIRDIEHLKESPANLLQSRLVKTLSIAL